MRRTLRAAHADDAAPFAFQGDRRGVLCIHGFTGSPFEVKLLGEALAARGHTVHGPRLAGHDPDGTHLAGSTWKDWYASVETALDELRARCDRVAVCGLSLGGLLTLELARRRPRDVAAIVVMATPVFLSPWQSNFVRLSQRKRFLRRASLPKLLGSDVRDREMRRRNPEMAGWMPLAPLASLVELGDHVLAHLGEIDRPTLVVHGRHDHVVPFACAESIARGLAGPVERLDLDRSFHLVTLDVERETLFARAGDFVSEHLGAA